MKTKTEKIAWRIFLLALAVAMLCGVCACSKKVYVPAERVVVRTDSVAVRRADSLTRLLASRDSVIVRDSVFVMLRGDTVVKEAWRIRERVSVMRDTLRIGSGFTLAETHRDTIREPQMVEVETEVVKEVEKKPPWWKRTLQYTGGVALILLMLWIAAKAILRRFIPKI